MITYLENITQDMELQGFKVKLNAPFNIEFTEGSFFVTDEKFNYINFDFDVETNEHFDVIYDIYLLKQQAEDGTNIFLTKTIIDGINVPSFDEDLPLLHCLATILVPSNAKSIEDINVRINNVSLKNKGEN